MADSEGCSSDSAALRKTVVEQTRSMHREPEKVWERERWSGPWAETLSVVALTGQLWGELSVSGPSSRLWTVFDSYRDGLRALAATVLHPWSFSSGGGGGGGFSFCVQSSHSVFSVFVLCTFWSVVGGDKIARSGCEGIEPGLMQKRSDQEWITSSHSQDKATLSFSDSSDMQVGISGVIPFTWEEQPGRPKQALRPSSALAMNQNTPADSH